MKLVKAGIIITLPFGVLLSGVSSSKIWLKLPEVSVGGKLPVYLSGKKNLYTSDGYVAPHDSWQSSQGVVVTFDELAIAKRKRDIF